jgi:anaerobic magnesium-protoporphyrin IX monomethyl ester cyclase
MNVLLVKPHVPGIGKGNSPALGLGYIASSLLLDNHEVFILDLTLYEKEGNIRNIFEERFIKINPDVVGITANTRERRYAFDCARWSKSLDATVPVVMGGCHVTCRPEETLQRLQEIDVVVRGEGEVTMRELCAVGFDNLSKFDSISGIAFRNNKREIVQTPPRSFNENLNELPFPAYHLMEMEKYDLTLNIPGENGRFTHIITSRGCPYKCGFCSASIFSGARVRYRSTENVLAEIEYLMSKYSFLAGVMFLDDFFLANKNRVLQVCEEIINRKMKFKWYAWSRVDAIDVAILPVLKKAGCITISMGVESGSDYVLHLMNKKTTAKKALQAVRTLKKFGLYSRVSLIFNYPGERYRDIIATYFFMIRARLRPFEITAGYTPILYPDTQLTETVRSMGYLPDNYNWVDTFDGLNYDAPNYIPKDILVRRIIHKVFSVAYSLINSLTFIFEHKWLVSGHTKH